jgi:ABC-type uncharacterized transport system YnjBCD ATPase subunit
MSGFLKTAGNCLVLLNISGLQNLIHMVASGFWKSTLLSWHLGLFEKIFKTSDLFPEAV